METSPEKLAGMLPVNASLPMYSVLQQHSGHTITLLIIEQPASIKRSLQLTQRSQASWQCADHILITYLQAPTHDSKD